MGNVITRITITDDDGQTKTVRRTWATKELAALYLGRMLADHDVLAWWMDDRGDPTQVARLWSRAAR